MERPFAQHLYCTSLNETADDGHRSLARGSLSPCQALQFTGFVAQAGPDKSGHHVLTWDMTGQVQARHLGIPSPGLAA